MIEFLTMFLLFIAVTLPLAFIMMGTLSALNWFTSRFDPSWWSIPVFGFITVLGIGSFGAWLVLIMLYSTSG